MNEISHHLAILLLLCTVLLGYELLLTWQRTSTVLVRKEIFSDNSFSHLPAVGRLAHKHSSIQHSEYKMSVHPLSSHAHQPGHTHQLNHTLQSNDTMHSINESGRVKIMMNEDLLKLGGVRVYQNMSLVERGFPSVFYFNSSAVRDRLKFIDIAVNNTNPHERSATAFSLNPDLLNRSMFQHEQIERYCHKHHQPLTKFPQTLSNLDTLFQHLLYDDTRQIVFCYVPKNGCSNMKRMMLVLNGLLSPVSVRERRPNEDILKQVHSFRNLTETEAVYRLKHYFKFAIVRNPAERLLSAYRNKLERPFIAEFRRHFPERLKAFILKRMRRPEFERWIALNNSSVDIHPTFEEFVHFMTLFPLTNYNEHFKPMIELCAPCAVDYDVFLSFKSLEYDVFALMEYLDVPFSFYPNSISHKSEPTVNYLDDYYQQVSLNHKSKLFQKLSHELEFYYSLHPEEWGMHNHL